MENWISCNLSQILGFSVPDDLINYIRDIKTEKELDEYMMTLLDFDNNKHKNFFLELCKQKFPGKGNSKQQSKKSKSKLQDTTNITQPSASTVEPEQKTKKKTKYVNLYSQEGKNAQVAFVKGRHHCECQASKHGLVNNCIQCGRVVCKQEGSGPCLFCGNLVCTPEEQKEINSKSKNSVKLVESLMERNRPKGWEAALTHRNRLLEYDRTSERRTKVTDDDSDYFNTNSVWLNSKERDKLQKYQEAQQDKKHGSRLNKKMTFDFAGRQIIEDGPEADDEELQQMIDDASNTSQDVSQHSFSNNNYGDRDIAPGINAPLLEFDPSVGGLAIMPQYSVALKGTRVQDTEIQEICDTGKCLSMHQPWASLLIEGIKLHEGRTWYHSHRGRLWIAATAKPPIHEEVEEVQNMYKLLYPEREINFPSFYPTGCLLGCVNVDDCLAQEEYQKRYPGGESDSPFVFICSNPISLRLRFPIKGQHKIYSLDKSIHQAAVKSIQKMFKNDVSA